MRRVEVQGHRGARGLAPENTLPSVAAALACGADSVEVDLHATADGRVVLTHDPDAGGVPVRSLPLAELRRYDMPTLEELLDFPPAAAAGVLFDLEIKRVPFAGDDTSVVEDAILRAVGERNLWGRVRVRSFDHRVVRRLTAREPRLVGAVLVAGTAPVAPEELARAAGAAVYCPDVASLDAEQVRRCRDAGVAVIPWTANRPGEWDRLLAWGVDGITTDDPDRLARHLGR